MEGEEISDFQQSLLRRLNTLQKHKKTAPPPAPIRGQANRQRAPEQAQVPEDSKTANSFVEELQLRRNSSRQGIGSSELSRENSIPGGARGGRGKPTPNGGPPPIAPKRRETTTKMTRPPLVAGSAKASERDSREAGASESTSNNTRKKANDLASKMGWAQNGNRTEVSDPTPAAPVKPKPKPARAGKPLVGGKEEEGGAKASSLDEEVSYMNFKRQRQVQVTPNQKSQERTPAYVQPEAKPPREVTGRDGPRQGQEVAPPLPKRFDESGDSAPTRTTPPLRRRLSQRGPLPPEEPSPATPKRKKSFRAAKGMSITSITSDSSVTAGGDPSVHSGSNSGTSGDGLVSHPMSQKTSPRDTTEYIIPPTGSSSESDMSGDGRVQRLAIEVESNWLYST